jgi:proline dehydrogenase
MISFENTEVAFRYKSNKELKRALWLFKFMASPAINSLGTKLLATSLKLKLPVNGLIRNTAFAQFCGGESMDECTNTMKNLAQYGVKSLLDYSVEGKEEEEDFNKTAKMISKTIDVANENHSVPFAVFKLTGVMSFSLLQKLNDSKPLTDQEEKQYIYAIKRIDKICRKAHSLKVPVMIDAEESWIQDAIDQIVEEMMMNYNKEMAVVYNTIQMYRHDRLEFLGRSHKHSQKHGYYLGVKVVRGAYMEKERERAEEMGYPSPIQATKEDTDKDYDLALDYIMNNRAGISLCAGTHNEESSDYLCQLMKIHKVKKEDSKIYFAQLLGMSDHISFNLAEAGYNVVKYVPFGPIKDVMPYLIRRAEENTSIAGQTGRELKLLTEEVQRRKKA